MCQQNQLTGGSRAVRSKHRSPGLPQNQPKSQIRAAIHDCRGERSPSAVGAVWLVSQQNMQDIKRVLYYLGLLDEGNPEYSASGIDSANANDVNAGQIQ
jgi:hypothetical protein